MRLEIEIQRHKVVVLVVTRHRSLASRGQVFQYHIPARQIEEKE